jgi:hypothetical protein
MSPFYNITGVGLWQPTIARARHVGGSDEARRERDFAYRAMYQLDMPLIGGASGGMGSYLLTFAAIGQRQGIDLQYAFLAATSVMIGKGYHSFHELATVAATMGVSYTPGDYFSVIPPAVVRRHRGIRELIVQFPELVFGAQLDSLLHAVRSAVRGRVVQWDRRVAELRARLGLWQYAFNRLPAEQRQAALDTYLGYLAEQGLDHNSLAELLDTSAQQAAQLRLLNPPGIPEQTMARVYEAIDRLLERVNAAPGGALDLGPELQALDAAIDQWRADYDAIRPIGGQARRDALDVLTGVIERDLNMSIADLNALLAGSAVVQRL